ADRLGVADVEVAVRLGREAGGDPAAVLALAQVLFDDLANEVGRSGHFPIGHGVFVIQAERNEIGGIIAVYERLQSMPALAAVILLPRRTGSLLYYLR